MAANPQDNFSGDVGLEDLIKVFRAHGVEVDRIQLDEGSGSEIEMVKIKKGDLIDSFDADPVIYSGKAKRLARRYEVPIPDLYRPDQFKSKS